MPTVGAVQLWGESRTYVSEVLLDGIARAGVKSKCTTMGRSAMSLDLQVPQRFLQIKAAASCHKIILVSHCSVVAVASMVEWLMRHLL